jgi:hypothetical protein
MAPGGVEPPHADSKSAALPLSYGAVPGSVCQTESRVPGVARGEHRRPAPPAASACRRGARGVAEGTRTPDHRDHNPGLYQLSYRHREQRQDTPLQAEG